MQTFNKILTIITREKESYGHAAINKQNIRSLKKAKREIENEIKKKLSR